ncbi:MAG: FKBP-type peptidyl-prolyl cis-trans isomerase N-terminal domain-containing protein [Francisella endosymbiont of Hyalomma asiaticum]
MKLAKTLLIASLVAGALITTCFAVTPDIQDDVSYSVGYTMGQTLKNQMDQNNISTDNQEMFDGLKDGINGKKSKLTPAQVQNAIIEFQKQAMAAQKK